MYLKHLSLTNFRNFTRLDINLPRRVIVLVGRNAQGKTSVLEAIYFLAAFTSFQTHTDRQLVNFIAAREPLAVARLTAEFTRGKSNHRLEVRLILEPTGTNGQRLRREILLDGVKRPTTEAIGQFKAVLFVPQMSQILEGGPEDRRRYLNLTLAQVVPAYTSVLSEYHQALTQRNALLKALNERGGNSDQLEVWDQELARTGSRIILWRIQAVQEIERLAARAHNELTRGEEILRLAYEPAYDPLPKPNGQMGLRIKTVVDRSTLDLKTIESGFLERLEALRGEEIARGVTTVGPHRDELRFYANNVDLGDYGSRGQVRTTLLALKLAEVSWMRERTGEWPVILLDEVMAELDLGRRADLQNYLSGAEQVLFTSADIHLFSPEFVAGAAVWEVQGGLVQERSKA
ncbi:MAG TPA: DNA replication/repair protein RecF [Anaerolineales bacterium]